MKTVTMLELRQDAEKILGRIQKGEQMLLTYRGKPVARLTPVRDEQSAEDDPFFALDRLASPKGRSFGNRQMDKIIYGE